ncbi:MAG TPA: hypothetical protein VK563_07150 [Puia sp.]|nr:hypothetical protein [Puia sp.]
MGLTKPYHRNYREFINGFNSGYSGWAFIVDKEYAESPHHYTRAFLLLQEDVKNLFDFIEPADINLKAFSFRIHELLMRTCIEVEANFKAILRENIYTPYFKSGSKAGQPRTEDYWKINDYIKVNKTHHLDSYVAEFPFWRGAMNRYAPFANWAHNGSLSWYQAYNETKHDRNNKFEIANFENLITAFCGLFVLLSSQFNCEGFTTGSTFLSTGGDSYFAGQFGIGNYLKIEFPTNWQDAEKYDFDWSKLKEEADRFEKIDYNIL